MSKDKIKIFNDKTNQIISNAFKEYGTIFINEEDKEIDKEIKTAISGSQILFEKSAFVDNDIPNLNYDSVFAGYLASEVIRRYIPNSFIIAKTRNYLLNPNNILKGIERSIDGTNIDEIIIRYLDGTATDSDKEQLLTWLKESDKNLHSYSEFRDVWFASQSNSSVHSDMEKALKRLEKRIKGKESEKKINIVSPYNFYKTARVAAFFALLFIIGITFYHIGRNVTKKDILILNHLITDSGSKRRFVLPDSTIVWLNSNSKLEYPTTFSESSREISLEGEAYFEVSHDVNKPFHVHAGDMDIEVLGTHFSVENYPDKKGVEAVLAEGRIKVTGSEIPVPLVLEPGELIRYDKSNKQTVVKKVDAENYISWIQNELTFDNAKLADIVMNLKKWYSIDIECDSSIGQNLSMSFTLHKGEDLDEILKAMTLIIPVRYYWKDNVLNIVSVK